MNAQEILTTLDARCYDWFEPIINPIDSHFSIADTRLTVFRSEQQWVIFFEIVQYNVGTNEYEVRLCAYGDCLREKSAEGMDLNDILPYRHPFEFDEEATSVYPETDSWILERDRISIWLHGQHLEFRPTPEEYKAAGIVFDEKQEGPDTIAPEQLLRFLCHHLDHPFFNSEDYLRSVIEANQAEQTDPVYHQIGLSHHLSLFVQTRQWQHTDFNIQIEYECPSEVPGFQVLARAIASGDLTEWNQQDAGTFNTDWRPWEAERRAERERDQAYRQQQAELFGQLPPEVQQQILQTQQKIRDAGLSNVFSSHFEMVDEAELLENQEEAP